MFGIRCYNFVVSRNSILPKPQFSGVLKIPPIPCPELANQHTFFFALLLWRYLFIPSPCHHRTKQNLPYDPNVHVFVIYFFFYVIIYLASLVLFNNLSLDIQEFKFARLLWPLSNTIAWRYQIYIVRMTLTKRIEQPI